MNEGYVVSCLFLLLFPLNLYAHGGGLNADGCHNNRKTGDYHCHKPPPPSREIQQQIDSPSTKDNQPTCFVGPKGGTYTITPSGRKNYQGC
jgi:hypothetical protein